MDAAALKAQGLTDDDIKALSEMYTFLDNGGDSGIDTG